MEHTCHQHHVKMHPACQKQHFNIRAAAGVQPFSIQTWTPAFKCPHLSKAALLLAKQELAFRVHQYQLYSDTNGGRA
eukprot:366406-Chlamydomonas_euryale.AAC.23